MWLHAPNIKCTHGFSDRHGGLSSGAFASLNLGGSDDEPNIVLQNRQLSLQKLDLSHSQLCYLKQVHGSEVCIAKPGQQEGDAIVSNQKDLVLAVSVADCYPILFYDEVNKVAGAAHAGWRGTQAKIAENTLNRMLDLGAEKNHIQVAIGQGISLNNFEVGPEVIEKFKAAGFPEDCWSNNKLDLVACNVFVLLQNNILEKNIWTMNRCTFEADFFSHRRDKGITGRMWGLIALN